MVSGSTQIAYITQPHVEMHIKSAQRLDLLQLGALGAAFQRSKRLVSKLLVDPHLGAFPEPSTPRTIISKGDPTTVSRSRQIRGHILPGGVLIAFASRASAPINRETWTILLTACAVSIRTVQVSTKRVLRSSICHPRSAKRQTSPTLADSLCKWGGICLCSCFYSCRGFALGLERH